LFKVCYFTYGSGIYLTVWQNLEQHDLHPHLSFAHILRIKTNPPTLKHAQLTVHRSCAVEASAFKREEATARSIIDASDFNPTPYPGSFRIQKSIVNLQLIHQTLILNYLKLNQSVKTCVIKSNSIELRSVKLNLYIMFYALRFTL